MGMLRAMNNALTSVFGCRHERTSRIFTIQHQSYTVCLGCGHRTYYAPGEMRRMTRREVRAMQVAQAPAAQDGSPDIAA